MPSIMSPEIRKAIISDYGFGSPDIAVNKRKITEIARKYALKRKQIIKVIGARKK